MDGNTSMLHLTLPEQTLASLTFCEDRPKSFRDWADELPMANIGETSRRLYHAVIELNQFICSPAQRLALLELIRPPIHYVCNELARHYLGHSVSLPEKQRKVANLAQALQLHLAAGYKQTLSDLVKGSGFEKNKPLVAQCAHRAISDLSRTVLRSAQLYCPSPTHSWLDCHRIIRFIQDRQLATLSVADDSHTHTPDSTVEEAYKRLLLLGCCRPNQLRQNELSQVFGLFESWAKHTRFSAERVADALFIVNTECDAPPIYRTLLTGPMDRGFFGFETTELAQRLTETLQQLREKPPGQPLLEMPKPSNESLLMQMSQALGVLTKRSFKRLADNGRLQVCVGMSAAHYFSAGKIEFNRFLGGSGSGSDENNVFMTSSPSKGDTWSSAPDVGPMERQVSPDTPIHYRGASGGAVNGNGWGGYASAQVPLLNTSPGGYCLHWEEPVPAALQAGEILAVREQDSHPWSLAVIRWIRQVRHQGTQVGVELLAPNSTPCAIRLIQKVGSHSEYLRCLLLPELGSIGQPATLITPRMPFQAGNRVTLLRNGRAEECQLSRRVSATGSISQFELRFFSPVEPDLDSSANAHPGNAEDNFDSLWPSL